MKTITQKILARAANLTSVEVGQEITFRPDYVMAYELRGITDKLSSDLTEKLNIERVSNPERFVMFIDHRVPAQRPEDQALHEETQKWTQEQNITLIQNEGIGHQVATEKGYAKVGTVLVHFDNHIMQIGAFGALGFGIRTQLIQAFAQGAVTMPVPASARVRFTGSLGARCNGRDVLHAIINRIGADGCSFKVLEFDERHLGNLSVEAMQTITGMAMFTGAVSAIVNPEGASSFTKNIDLRSDDNAVYEPDVWINLDNVQPSIAVPPTPAHVRSIDDLLGLPVQVGYLGSCASGRLEDLRAAAEILEGRQIVEGFSLYVVPTSRKIMEEASKEGILSTLIQAGAFISSSSCDFCAGYIGVMSDGQRAVSTGTLNVPGRMGSVDSEIFLCSPYTLAASALNGFITDPRSLT